MKPKYLLFLILVVTCFTVFATSRKHKKLVPKGYFTLLESYTQRFIPGIRGAHINISTNFVIVWDTNNYNPETFFWRGDACWQTCKIMKAHKVPAEYKQKMPRGIDYRTEMLTNLIVNQGDTLMITPVAGGKFPIPKEIPDSSRNDLYFKAGGSGWIRFHIDTITKKHDIVAP